MTGSGGREAGDPGAARGADRKAARRADGGPGAAVREFRGRPLVDGSAAGPLLRLDEPLSFWGGLDPASGRIIDRRHPQHGLAVTARVLLMPGGRGSSSSSTVLAEAIRLGTGPAAILLTTPDPIIAVGALVAVELYGRVCPVVVVGSWAGPAGVEAAVAAGGLIRLAGGPADPSPRGNRRAAAP